MKKTISTIAICLMFTGCANGQYINPRQEDIIRIGSLMKSVENASTEHAYMIYSGASLQDLTEKTGSTEVYSGEIDNICQGYNDGTNSDFRFYMKCRNIVKDVAIIRGEMMFADGKYAAKNGKNEDAKRIFREIITTFTGTAYKSIVKQAELELEDLKQAK